MTTGTSRPPSRSRWPCHRQCRRTWRCSVTGSAGQTGKLRWALADNYVSIKGGFSLDVHLHGSRGTTATVIHLQAEIAKLYDVAIDQVSIEYNPQIRSEARARVTVITTTAMEDTPQRLDGQSTYNPETGRFQLGRFMDRQPTHWQWHAPQSGAACGLISGVIGSGKTGTAHRLACEAGLAKIDGQRIGMLLMGDPQMQPFSVWRGRSDLMAAGASSVRRTAPLAGGDRQDSRRRHGQRGMEGPPGPRQRGQGLV